MGINQAESRSSFSTHHKEHLRLQPGRTVLVHALGSPEAVDMAEKFLQTLNSPKTRDEIAGVIVPSRNNAKERMQAALGKPLLNPFHKNPDVLTSLESAKRTFGGQSEVRTVLHFVAYGDTSQDIQAQLSGLQDLFPDQTHIAIVRNPRYRVKRFFDERQRSMYPPENFGMPIITLDEERCKILDDEAYKHYPLKTEDAFFFGLGALVNAHRLLPHLNPQTHGQIFEALAGNHNAINVGIGISDIPVLSQGLRRNVIPLNGFIDEIAGAAASSLRDDRNITPVSRDPASLHVVSIGIPLDPSVAFLHEKDTPSSIEMYTQEKAKSEGFEIPNDTIFVYSSPRALTRSDQKFAYIVATHFSA